MSGNACPRRPLLLVFLASMAVMITSGGCAHPQARQPLPSVRSLEVHTDHSVTFRLRAPRAKEVMVSLETLGPIPMRREEPGVWWATTPPLEPDLYGYSFSIDGVSVLDPSNPLFKPNLISSENVVHVHGPTPLPWEVAAVAHGSLHHHFYSSAIVGDARDFYVYTPPGYEAAGTKSYPVLYLLLGFSDDASGWSAVGRVHVIADNLLDRGKIKPMVIVMPLGYGAPEILVGGFTGLGKDPSLMQRNFDKFGQSLLLELVPRIEHEYRVAVDRESRAIAGLSMGGSESLLTGLNHLDQFAWIGSFSFGGLTEPFEPQFPALLRTHNDGGRPRLLWISCGTSDHLIDVNRRLDAWFGSRSVNHVFSETTGGHNWTVWRRNLIEFAELLFRPAPTP